MENLLLTYEDIICPECHSNYTFMGTHEYSEIVHSRSTKVDDASGRSPSQCSRAGENHLFKPKIKFRTEDRIEGKVSAFIQIYHPHRTCPTCKYLLSRVEFLSCGLRVKLWHTTNAVCDPVILPLARFTVFI